MNIQTWISQSRNHTETLGSTNVLVSAEELALFPKAIQKSFTAYAEGYGLKSLINFYANAATGERNEAGIKRLVTMIAKVEAAGMEITTDWDASNAASLDDIKRLLAA